MEMCSLIKVNKNASYSTDNIVVSCKGRMIFHSSHVHFTFTNCCEMKQMFLSFLMDFYVILFSPFSGPFYFLFYSLIINYLVFMFSNVCIHHLFIQMRKQILCEMKVHRVTENSILFLIIFHFSSIFLF